jgi:hypothetical protein
VGDIKGIILLMYRILTNNTLKAISTMFKTKEDYKNIIKAIVKLLAGNLERLNLVKYYNYINLASFKVVTGGLAIEINIFILVVRPILLLIILWCNKGQVICLNNNPLKEIIVGGDILLYYIIIVEL